MPVLVVIFLLTFPVVALCAVPVAPTNPPVFKLEARTVQIPETDVTADSAYSMSLVGFQASWSPIPPAGLHAGYTMLDYEFSGPGSMRGADPWGTIHMPEAGFHFRRKITGNWQAAIRGTAGLPAEEEADQNEAVVIGLIPSAGYAWSRERRIALGAGVFSGLEETTVFPMIVLHWKFNDQLTLANPLKPGISGPAGLELIWHPAGRWQFAVGGAYRDYRFRLNDEGPSPDGIGEHALLPVWLRFGFNATPACTLSLISGGALNQEFTLEDSRGSRTETVEPDPSWFAGASAEFVL